MTKTVRTARQIKIKIKIKIKIPAVPLMEHGSPNSLQQPTNYQGGKVKVELVQTDDDGNTYSDQSMEVDDSTVSVVHSGFKWSCWNYKRNCSAV